MTAFLFCFLFREFSFILLFCYFRSSNKLLYFLFALNNGKFICFYLIPVVALSTFVYCTLLHCSSSSYCCCCCCFSFHFHFHLKFFSLSLVMLWKKSFSAFINYVNFAVVVPVVYFLSFVVTTLSFVLFYDTNEFLF